MEVFTVLRNSDQLILIRRFFLLDVARIHSRWTVDISAYSVAAAKLQVQDAGGSEGRPEQQARYHPCLVDGKQQMHILVVDQPPMNLKRAQMIIDAETKTSSLYLSQSVICLPSFYQTVLKNAFETTGHRRSTYSPIVHVIFRRLSASHPVLPPKHALLYPGYHEHIEEEKFLLLELRGHSTSTSINRVSIKLESFQLVLSSTTICYERTVASYYMKKSVLVNNTKWG